ncbi:MAG TPA: hypothetical protein VNU68_05075 [Verrucomicrobiae bacterium]|nr:hypothetical protein [Verrucomicrobiae bacterium]
MTIYRKNHPQCLEFGRECVASKKWGGRVPPTLLDVHINLARYAAGAGSTNYWRQPEVSTDVRASFEKFFSLNPNAVSWRHNYAYYAYQCGQYAVFIQQLGLFGSQTNYSYFAGKPAFELMVQTAQKQLTTRQ